MILKQLPYIIQTFWQDKRKGRSSQEDGLRGHHTGIPAACRFPVLMVDVSGVGIWNEMASLVGAVPGDGFFVWMLAAGKPTGFPHDYSNSYNNYNNKICHDEPCLLTADSSVCLELPHADVHISIVPNS